VRLLRRAAVAAVHQSIRTPPRVSKRCSSAAAGDETQGPGGHRSPAVESLAHQSGDAAERGAEVALLCGAEWAEHQLPDLRYAKTVCPEPAEQNSS